MISSWRLGFGHCRRSCGASCTARTPCFCFMRIGRQNACSHGQPCERYKDSKERKRQKFRAHLIRARWSTTRREILDRSVSMRPMVLVVHDVHLAPGHERGCTRVHGKQSAITSKCGRASSCFVRHCRGTIWHLWQHAGQAGDGLWAADDRTHGEWRYEDRGRMDDSRIYDAWSADCGTRCGDISAFLGSCNDNEQRRDEI